MNHGGREGGVGGGRGGGGGGEVAGGRWEEVGRWDGYSHESW